MKAMILAAGLGERMQPLSCTQPKPLLKAGKYRLIEHNLIALEKAGITDIIINVHHHAEQIISTLGDGQRYQVSIQYSHEQNQLLGTGGGITRALPLLGSEPFLLLSADIWTDYPFQKLHSRTIDDAHLIMVENPAFHPKGDYSLNSNHQITLPRKNTLTYASMGVFNPKLFDTKLTQPFHLTHAIEPAIQSKRVSGEHYKGQWWNVGTPELLAKLDQHLQ